MRNNNLILLLSSAVMLSGCVGAAIGAGATLGVAAAQEGGLSGAASDARIQVEINNLWFNYSVEAFRKLDLTINQGRVLVTGVVQDPEHRVEAIRLAWQPKGVKQVINEIQVADSPGVKGFAKDTWITTRLRTEITFDKNILSINYSIDTVNGTVYLMGFAQSRAELNRVIQKAKKIPGVVSVVSYVKIVSGDGAQGTSWSEVQGQSSGLNQSTGQNDFNSAPVEIAPAPAVESSSIGPVETLPPPSGMQGDLGASINSTPVQDGPYIERNPAPVNPPTGGGEEILWDQ